MYSNIYQSIPKDKQQQVLESMQILLQSIEKGMSCQS